MGTKKQIYKMFLVFGNAYFWINFSSANGAEGKELEKDDVAETDIETNPERKLF